MAHKKQPFRFRIPWLSRTPAARPATKPTPRRLKDRPKSPTKPDTNVPVQRPRSPLSPTKTQRAPRAEPQKQSPSHPTQPTTFVVIIESPVTSSSEPPSRSITPTAVNSLQPSSHAGSPSQVSIASSSPKTQPQSPTHSAVDGSIMVSKLAAEESTQLASSLSEQEKEKTVLSKPIRQEAEPTKHQSPSHLASDGNVVVPKPTVEEGSHPTLSVSEQENEKMVVSEPMPREAEPTINSPLKAIFKSPDTFSQPENLYTQPMPNLPKAPSETQSKSPETTSQHERTPIQPVGSKPPHASSVPCSSPSSKTEPAASQPSSPLASECISEVLKPSSDESTVLASSTSQEEKEKMVVAEPVLQETEPIKSLLKIILNSSETSSLQKNLSTHSKALLGDEERSKVLKAPLETKSKQSEEKEKMVHHQPIKAGKAKDTTSGQPFRRVIASASGTQDKYSFSRTFRADKKQHGAREIVDRKVMFASSNPSEQDIRVVSSSNQGTRNVSSISLERLVSSNEEKAPLQKGIKDYITKFVHKLAIVNPTQPMYDKQFSIITLAGDNKGATMHVGSESSKQERSIHIHHDYKANPKENTEMTIDGEKNRNTKKDSHRSTKHNKVGKAYVNSNIQSINNSLMFHGSVTERDPGVQVTLTQKPEEPIKSDDKLPLQTQKSEFNISRAEKSNYQPMVRRRFLRGLFVEPSDSDPDNPDKPYRHGCKLSCDKNEKVEDIEDL